ncbi:hypothetical protein JCM30237_19840 [Halolamina litorea]|jgi:hypothetical protein|uniref:Mechanosensitive ion channel domain-containing protein n=1 Tax=Halolamina litorea TaxID=1515593 RepID=A0ABD6BW39_9EURY|nr:mechanosensitive ion channel domain-containing protein [Halolamina litorea]
MLPLQLGVVQEGIDRFVGDIAAAIPRILAGLIFLVLAGVLAKLVMIVVRTVLSRTLDQEDAVYRRFTATVVAAFLWFGIGLSFLSIVGLDEIASSMGTAAGFLALGVSYSLSNMIADAVAGVYLLRDPDFMPGDEVKVGDISGTVESIELRKTRFTDENEDTVVRGNAEIEKKWTKLEDAESPDSEGGDTPADGGNDASVEEETDTPAGESTDSASTDAGRRASTDGGKSEGPAGDWRDATE